MVDPADLNQTIVTAADQPAGAQPAGAQTAALSTYTDWEPLSSGPDGLGYRARRGAGGVSIELRVIRPIAIISGLAAQLEQRVRLIELCKTELIRRVADCSLGGNLPLIAIEQPCSASAGDRTLQQSIDEDLPLDRLAVARELLTAYRVAHRIGLYPGRCTAADVILNKHDHCRIDFTGVNVSAMDTSDVTLVGFAQSSELGEGADLVCLNRLLQQLLGDESVDLSSLPPRSRAALRSLLRNDGLNAETAPSLIQWETVLGIARVTPRGDDPDNTMETAPPGHAAEQFLTEDTSHADTDATGELMAAGMPHDVSSGSGQWQAARPPLEPGSTIGRYRLQRKLGQGGMGVVFEGIDLSNGDRVAIKVLWSRGKDSPQAIRRFHKESRLLASVQNDHVTRLHEVGEDDGHHFIAMEFIDGVTLKDWLADSGAVNETVALEVVADISKGLLEAHAKGIVHRDIKPENILLEHAADGSNELRSKRVKLSDFGIARQVDQSASLDVTQAGSLLGTPRYMSPEQCRGSKEIGPAADVYSLGITLYELLTGSPPFAADDALRLAAMHCFDTPPDLLKKVPAISELTVAIVNRSLAKAPEDRYADAAQMLAAIQRVLRGEAADFELHPRLPEHDPARLWKKTFTWDLKSSPSQLWPYVSNTERLNKAIGLPPVTYRTENDPTRGLRKFGSFKLGGIHVSWEEHPFEWIEGSRMGIVREFDSGPFKWFMSIVELKPRPDGGTRLEHSIRIESRNWIGRIMSTVEADWRGGRNLDRVYTRIDKSLQQQLDSDQGNDAFEAVEQLKKTQVERIDQRVERIIEQGVDRDVAAAIGEFIATAPAKVLAQVRPLALAEQLNLNSEQCVTACLRAAAAGLFVIRWEILCPTCRVSASAEGLLSSIKEHTHCVACDYDFKSDLGEAIELTFRVHPEIREVDDAIYCIGGPEHSPHVVAQVRLEPSERIELEVKLIAGDYLIRGPRLMGQQRIRVRSTPAPSQHEFLISTLGKSDHTPVMRDGSQALTMVNDLDHLQVMRIERMIPRDDIVTATHASTLPLFRELFPDQVIGQNRPIDANEMTLVATSICDVDELYERLGDRDAYELIGRHLDVLRLCIASHRGTVAKTVGEGVLAAFNDCEHAVDAALTLQTAINDEPGLESIRLSIGVNRGRTLVATMNQRLDYFGSTARAVSALPDLAAGDILLTESVFSDPQVQATLRSRGVGVSIETISLPGRPGQIVQRVTVPRG